MIQYLLKHHKRKILSALNHRLTEGALDRAFGCDVSGHKVTSDCVEFIGMEYWRLDMYNVLVDMNLAVTLTLADGSKTVQLYGEIYVDGHHQFQFNFGNFGAYKDKPDRDLIRMSSYLVPYLRKNDLEKEMELLLAKHGLSDIEGGAARRAMLLAKRMGLRVQSMCLCNHDKTESVLFFQESRVLVYVRNEHGEEEETEMQTVPANTIVINERVLLGSNYDAPIFHECVHYELHFLFYRLQQMYHDNDVSRVRTKKLIVKNGKVPKDPLKWMEWQAQRGAYALMMHLCGSRMICIPSPKAMRIYFKKPRQCMKGIQINHCGVSQIDYYTRRILTFSIPLLKADMAFLVILRTIGEPTISRAVLR